MRKLFRDSLLAALVSLPLLTGCKSTGYKEDSRGQGTATFSGRMGLGSSGEVFLSVCNDATYVREVSDFPGTEIIIDYSPKKNAFVKGEPIEFVLNSDYGIPHVPFVAELLRNGEAVPERRYFSPNMVRWLILPYPNLDAGNYTVQIYAGHDKEKEFIGNLDFEVIANPEAKK